MPFSEDSIAIVYLATFGNYLIKPYIPRVWGDFSYLLTIERNAHQFWSQPFTPVSQKRKAAIEVTSTHTDAMTLVIERHKRGDDKINGIGSDYASVHWLPKSVIIPFKICVGRKSAKNHFAAQINYWRENALFCAPCALDDCCRVDLVVNGKVARNRFARHEFVRVNNSIADF